MCTKGRQAPTTHELVCPELCLECPELEGKQLHRQRNWSKQGNEWFSLSRPTYIYGSPLLHPDYTPDRFMHGHINGGCNTLVKHMDEKRLHNMRQSLAADLSGQHGKEHDWRGRVCSISQEGGCSTTADIDTRRSSRSRL